MILETEYKEMNADKSLPKAHFYEKLYELANVRGTNASVAVETFAVTLSDGSIMPDGICGYAWVVLPDGRKGFARWVLKNGLGSIVDRRGVWIRATASQSQTRCEAYATAFSEVLESNGIECYTISSID